MDKINCTVSNCSHNNSGTCYANTINISGGESSSSCNTCCSSFLNESTYGNLTNNTNGGGCCSILTCSVEGCIYNENNQCKLDSINVSGNNAEVYGNTECSSFESI